MKNTAEGDWQRAVPADEPAQLVRDLAAAGFCAIEIDTLGFAHKSDPRPGISAELGDPVAQTSDGEFVAYRIPAELAAEGSKDRLLRPVLIILDGSVPDIRDGVVGQWVGPQSDLRILNLTDKSLPLHISMSVEAAGQTARDIHVADRDGRQVASGRLPSKGAMPIEVDLTAPRGTSTLELTLSGRALRLASPSITASGRVSNVRVATTAPVRAVSLQQQNADGVVGFG